MIRRKISGALAIMLAAGTLNGFIGTEVFAKDNANPTSVQTEVQTKVQTETVNNHLNYDYIQSKYLRQAKDGTFYLDKSMKNEFSNEQIEQLEYSMNGINELIKKGVLKFEVQLAKDGNIKSITNTVNNYEEYSKNNKEKAYGRVLGSYDYCYNYVFSWWGYTTHVNPAGSNRMKAWLEVDIAKTGIATGSLVYLMTQMFPGFNVALATAAAAVGTIPALTAKQRLQDGYLSKKGTIVTGVSDPYKGVWFKAELPR